VARLDTVKRLACRRWCCSSGERLVRQSCIGSALLGCGSAAVVENPRGRTDGRWVNVSCLLSRHRSLIRESILMFDHPVQCGRNVAGRQHAPETRGVPATLTGPGAEVYGKVCHRLVPLMQQVTSPVRAVMYTSVYILWQTATKEQGRRDIPPSAPRGSPLLWTRGGIPTSARRGGQGDATGRTAD